MAGIRMVSDGIRFKSYGHKALTHATKDGKTTLCGLKISNVWAATTEQDFHDGYPCSECASKLRRVMRKGAQLTL